MVVANAVPSDGVVGAFEQGRLAFARADYAASEQFFLDALAAGSDERSCRNHLGRIYNLRQEWVKAAEQWRWLRDHQPLVLEPQLQIARALFRLNRFEEAGIEYRRVMELEADHPEAAKRLTHIDNLPKGQMIEEGKTAFQAGQLDVSRNAFERALEAGADQGVCRQYLARIHNLKGEWELALEHWRWLGQKSPQAVEPQLQVARALFRLDRQLEAKNAFQAVLLLQADHPEAHRRLEELRSPDLVPKMAEEALLPAPVAANISASDAGTGDSGSVPQLDPTGRVHSGRPSLTSSPIGRTILADARHAFRRCDYLHAESLFRQALQAGAEESVCRLHLARIYNHLHEWESALEQWQWLHSQGESRLESTLQVARAFHRLNRLAEAASWYREVQAIEEGHVEAAERLQQIKAVQTDDGSDEARRSWLSNVPEPRRWTVAGDLLGGGLGSLEALVSRADRQAEALVRAAEDVGEAAGPLVTHRQLYGVQMANHIAELRVKLADAMAAVRNLSRRTEKLFNVFERSTGQLITPLRPLRQGPPLSLVRSRVEGLVSAVLAERGLDAALACLWREAPAEERATLLSSLGMTLRSSDRAAAARLFWLAYGANPSPAAAERAAIRLFQVGDLSGPAALLDRLPTQRSSGMRSAFGRTMVTTLTLFTKGLTIPQRSAGTEPAETSALAYVASGALPYQVAGYTVRTQALLESLPAAGIQPICFTQPGFPWDRPSLLSSGQDVPNETVIGNVRYVHTRWPRDDADPALGVEIAAQALADGFRQHGAGIVQAASNSRNALPALIAARRTGARFVYEVRGLWELTAAARFPGWETTERYRFDRELEIRTALEADHVLAITQGIADELVDGGVPRERISLLPNAVDPEQFAPMARNNALAASLGVRDEDFVVVYAGSLSSYEGLDDLIEAVGLLVREGVPARLVLVGDGEFRGALEAAAARLAHPGQVIFAGRAKPNDIRAYLSLADVVAIPRKPYRVCEVVSPLKPFEAMSMAKPVVLTNLPVLREIVDDGRTGLLCEPANPPALAATLRRLALDPGLRRRLGQAARDWVVAERSWARNARFLADLYEALGEDR